MNDVLWERLDVMFSELETLKSHAARVWATQEDAQRTCLEAGRSTRDIEEAVKTKEAMTLAVVSGEQEPGTTKLKYTSAETRKAAAAAALVNDHEYQGLKDKLFDCQGAKMNAELALGSIEGQLKSAGFVRDILVAQTHLLTTLVRFNDSLSHKELHG